MTVLIILIGPPIDRSASVTTFNLLEVAEAIISIFCCKSGRIPNSRNPTEPIVGRSHVISKSVDVFAQIVRPTKIVVPNLTDNRHLTSGWGVPNCVQFPNPLTGSIVVGPFSDAFDTSALQPICPAYHSAKNIVCKFCCQALVSKASLNGPTTMLPVRG